MLIRACIFTWKSIILFVLHTINEFGFTAFYRFSLQKKKPNALRHSMNCSHQYTKHGGLFTAMEIKRHLNNSLNRHISFVDSDGAFHFEFLTRIYYFNRKHFVACGRLPQFLFVQISHSLDVFKWLRKHKSHSLSIGIKWLTLFKRIACFTNVKRLSSVNEM